MNETVARKNFLQEFTDALSTLLARATDYVFGAGANRPVLGPLTRADLASAFGVVLLVLAAHGLAVAFLHRKTKGAAASETADLLRPRIFRVLGAPLYALIWVIGIYMAATTLLRKLLPADDWDAASQFLGKLVDLGVFAILFWLFFRLTRLLESRLAAWAIRTGSKLDELFVPLLGKCLRVMVPVVGVILALPVLGLPPQYAGLMAKGTSILLIVAVALILVEAVGLGEKIVLMKFDVGVADNLHARKVRTQLQVISKTLYILVGIFSVASILMLFEEVRHLGTSILASAGVVGVVLGFAAQKTIANLFAGFQIALAQPIRLDDVVVVAGEWGRIEEITLTYVVIHIWDDRRLIVPLSDFIEKSFENWTRTSAGLLGSVLLWVDYSLPLEETRDTVRQIIETNPLWDRRFWNLQVTDASERTMQIRVLVTAVDSSTSWNLRCDVREKLVAFIQKHHPQSLPRIRADWEPHTLEAAS
ncbi:MAG TPA: mechanosensitive ion channel domain-containing protein [Candidatus Baltobacteraceae bacterium]|jgi:small-conductance mechanosensitive channel|nr:mechanosensitive ion channel domain-containing protein [Candidatus Baltobacteraceae bacterium]